ncbi:hypothetical protein C2I18_07950 [Paenibacillus sp. PK3_47]|uniref:hypothetical protein n=1 Tax=Paenibacillus sp. PK3_47 TaxID=2072642 RepID=UPI00201DD942|nr:hypothetical protein [Paenibacillus sp. PK3_47]UQZ33496.1 hypothetical protein C2I18_07950 [Paenibacillus sp. PK3_47]
MTPKLILIEGLPGSGKSTTARLVHDILTDMKLNSRLYVEGDLDHPADYDGVAWFTPHSFGNLLSSHEQYRDFLLAHTLRQGEHYFLEYRKIKNEYGADFPDELMEAIFKNDIYELPLEQNRKLIAERWKKFTESAAAGRDTFIFDCCFIQNPVTVGMIKYDAGKEDVVSYVEELAAVVRQLNPLLIYVEQNDLDYSFRKAVKERPAAWSEGFIEYYTSQGYGKIRGCKGLEGTLQVLEARSRLEEEIYNGLEVAKVKVNNSSYDLSSYKQVLAGIVSAYFTSAP